MTTNRQPNSASLTEESQNQSTIFQSLLKEQLAVDELFRWVSLLGKDEDIPWQTIDEEGLGDITEFILGKLGEGEHTYVTEDDVKRALGELRLKKAFPDIRFDGKGRPLVKEYALEYFRLRDFDKEPDYTLEQLNEMLAFETNDTMVEESLGSRTFPFQYMFYRSLKTQIPVPNYDIIRTPPENWNYEEMYLWHERCNNFMCHPVYVENEAQFQRSWKSDRMAELSTKPFLSHEELQVQRTLINLQFFCLRRTDSNLKREVKGKGKLTIGSMSPREFEILKTYLSRFVEPFTDDETCMRCVDFDEVKYIKLPVDSWVDIPPLIDYNWHIRKYITKQGMLNRTSITKFGVVYNPHNNILYATLEYNVHTWNGYIWGLSG